MVASLQHPSFGSTTRSFNARKTQRLVSLHLLRTDRRQRNLRSTTSATAATNVPIVHNNDSAVGTSSLWTGDSQLPVTNERSASPTKKKTTKQLLIHWKGEAVIGSSLQFRHCEFYGALGSVLGGDDDSSAQAENMVQFSNALQYKQHDKPIKYPFMTAVNIQAYNEAMQYLDIVAEEEQEDDSTSSANASIRQVSTHDCIRAVQRCSLIHALY